MNFSDHISLGDLIVVATAFLAVAANYFGTIARIKAVEFQVNELRRGRGLILQDWPYRVRRCFGFDNGWKPDDVHTPRQ